MRTVAGARGWPASLLLACCTVAARAASPADDTVTPCAAGGACLSLPLHEATWSLVVGVASGLSAAVAIAAVWWLVSEAAERRRRRPTARPRGRLLRRRGPRVVAGPVRVDGTVVRVVEPVPGALRVEALGPRGWTSVDRDPRLFFAGVPGVGRGLG